MNKNPTQRQEINRRRQIVSKLRHEGVRSQADIVYHLQIDYGIAVTQQTVSNDLKALDELWRTSALVNTDKWKKEVLSQYRYLYQQSLAAWELSLEDASGNPAHIRNAQESLKAVREMCGLDAPLEIDVPKDSNFEHALLRAYGQNDTDQNDQPNP